MKSKLHIVHTQDAPRVERSPHESFQCAWLGLTPDLPGRKLGAGLFCVQPGLSAVPHHRHHGNDEAIYVLRGNGTLRLDQEQHQIGPGDYVALPARGPAHRLTNTGSEPLEYLCFSTMQSPEVVDYPDSGKVGCYSRQPILKQEQGGRGAVLFRSTESVDYYEGE